MDTTIHVLEDVSLWHVCNNRYGILEFSEGYVITDIIADSTKSSGNNIEGRNDASSRMSPSIYL